MHTSIYAYNANWAASTKNRSKTNRKSLRNRSQNGPKSIQNGSKIGPGSALEPMSLPTSILDRFRTVPGAILEPSWGPLGGQVGAKLIQKSIFGGLGRRSKTNLVFDTFQVRFLTHFGAIWGSKMEPKSLPKRSQERSSKKCKNVKKPLVLHCFLKFRGVENRSKIDQKRHRKSDEKRRSPRLQKRRSKTL